MERLAPLSRTKKDFCGTPPDISDDVPHIDTFNDYDLAEYFLGRLFVQGQIGLNSEKFPGTTPENLRGIRERTIASLRLDVEYAQSKGRIVPSQVLNYFKENPEGN